MTSWTIFDLCLIKFGNNAISRVAGAGPQWAVARQVYLYSLPPILSMCPIDYTRSVFVWFF